MTRDDILDSAKSIINGERQGTYGKAENSFAIIAQMWTAYLGKELSSSDVANMMVLMKVARNANGVYKDDNWIDICGQAALGGEIQSNQDNNFAGYNTDDISLDENYSIMVIDEYGPTDFEKVCELLTKVNGSKIIKWRDGYAVYIPKNNQEKENYIYEEF